MNQKLLPIIATAALILIAGCASEYDKGARRPQNTTGGAAENTDKFVLMDKQVQYSITCSGLQERVNEDGRLEVVANIRNRENRRIQVQVNCVFKDEQGFSTNDETPFQTLILGENSQEAVRFISMNNQARKYTVRVRQAR
ncbi:MAG: hypothetical protein RLY20_3354 [Verrucomicrobiota bacterium]|jgi:uncharacterized protein YcfL